MRCSFMYAKIGSNFPYSFLGSVLRALYKHYFREYLLLIYSARFGRDSERFHHIGGEFDDLDDGNSESDEQPAELVPLGMRTLSLSGNKSRRRHQKPRTNFSGSYLFVILIGWLSFDYLS